MILQWFASPPKAGRILVKKKKAKIFGPVRFPPIYKYTGVHKIVMGMQHPVNYVIALMLQPSNKSQLRVRKKLTDGSHTGVCHGTDS